MTGEKTKGKSLEKLWNLDDKTLKTPEHDKLVCYLLNKKNILKLFKPLIINDNWNVSIRPLIIGYGMNKEMWIKLKHKEELTKGEIEMFITEYYKIVDKNNIGQDPKLRKRDIENSKTYIPKKWKELIDEGICTSLQESLEKNILYISSEEPIKNDYNKFIVGFWDIVFGVDGDITTENFIFSTKSGDDMTFYIEVKPKIDSFGATLRQIKLYNEFTKGKYTTILFTPDTRFDLEFESQGIKVIHPPKGWESSPRKPK